MSDQLLHFTDSADWWKERPDRSEEGCGVGASSLEITKLIKRELQKSPHETGQIEKLQMELVEVKRDIALLKSAIFPPSGPRDDFSVWSESESATKYVGLFVAFVPGHGAIASAKTIRDLRPLIKEHKLGKKAAIASVPDALR